MCMDESGRESGNSGVLSPSLCVFLDACLALQRLWELLGR